MIYKKKLFFFILNLKIIDDNKNIIINKNIPIELMNKFYYKKLVF